MSSSKPDYLIWTAKDTIIIHYYPFWWRYINHIDNNLGGQQ